MDSKALVFLGLVSGPRQYRIPPFQRPYSWEKEDRETLWLDILTQYELVHAVWDQPEDEREKRLAAAPSHYLGTIVLSGPSSLGVPKSEIIDGQQRIMTLLIAVCSLRDLWGQILARTSGAGAAEAKRRTISNTYLVNDGQEGQDRYRVLPLSADEKVFRACVDSAGSGKLDAESLGLDPGDSARVLQAYKFFRTEMGRQRVGASNAQLARFSGLYPLQPAILEQVIAHRLSMIAIETQNLDNVNAIFESLNAKGRPLTQLDLLRNYVFMILGARAASVLRSHWDPIEKIYLPNRGTVEGYVWADVVARGNNVLQKRTYRTVQSEIRTAGGSSDVAEAYVRRLNRSAPIYAKILDPQKETHAVLSQRLARLSKAGGKTARPVLLWLYEQEHEGRGSMDEVETCVGLIESFLVRRFLNSMPPNNLNSMFGIMLSRLNNDTVYGDSVGGLESRLRKVMLVAPKEWPDNETLTEGVLHHDFYHNGDVRQRIHILQTLDLSYGYGLPPGYEESDDSIEHILPQSRPSAWVVDLTSLGHDMSTVQERWLHTLGNLTVVTPAENSQLGKKRFPDKAEIYSALDYKMTKSVHAFGLRVAGDLLWGPDEVERRATDLASRCCELWPRPTSGADAVSVAVALSQSQTEGVSEELDVEKYDAVPFTSGIAEDEDGR